MAGSTLTRRALRDLLHLRQEVVSPVVRQPGDLKGMIALEQPVGVVVDRLAGTRQKAGRGVLLAEDEVRIGFAALQGDPHGHLAERAAGQRIGAAQSLRAEEHVDAERTPLADESIEQQVGGRREGVVLHEEFLELVDDEQKPRQVVVGAGPAEALHVLRAAFAEEFAAFLQDAVQTLQHADAELAIALDADDPRMGQRVAGVRLELDPFLEVDQIELHLVRTVMQRRD